MSDSISDMSLLNLVDFKTIKKRKDRKLDRTKCRSHFDNTL